MKRAVAVPDAGAHVIGSSLTSKDVEGVYAQIEQFALEVLGMTSVMRSQEVRVAVPVLKSDYFIVATTR